MIESDFLQLTEKTFEEAEAFADANYPNSDSYREGNVMTIELEDGPSVVINRQEAMQEMWLAAPSGGFHFKHDADGSLRCTRDGVLFETYLQRALEGR